MVLRGIRVCFPFIVSLFLILAPAASFADDLDDVLEYLISNRQEQKVHDADELDNEQKDYQRKVIVAEALYIQVLKYELAKAENPEEK